MHKGDTEKKKGEGCKYIDTAGGVRVAQGKDVCVPLGGVSLKY